MIVIMCYFLIYIFNVIFFVQEGTQNMFFIKKNSQNYKHLNILFLNSYLLFINDSQDMFIFRIQ